MRAIVLSGSISLIIALLGTPLFIRYLRRREYGQFIRQDGPESHHVKRGTPTMGGVVIVLATLFGWLLGNVVVGRTPNVSSVLVVGLMVGLGFVGFLDDAIKLTRERSLGLNATWKIILQGVVGISFGLLALRFPDEQGITPASTAISFLRDTVVDLAVLGPALGLIAFVVWANFLITAWSNAVNLTDGLDGLAIGPVAIAAGTIGVFAYVAGNAKLAEYLQIAYVPGTGELLVFCGALVAAGLGFLWFNAYPAQMFMGDVGSLPLGAAIALVALAAKQELVLPLLGFVFVAEALSVIFQVVSFKLRRKRIFRMAPIHHHFELLGWPEPQIIVRFWIIAIICALLALATLKLR